MGLFSRKKKLTKEDDKQLEKDREELKKIKESEINEPKNKNGSEKTKPNELRAYSAEEITESIQKSIQNNTEWKLPKDNINWKILNELNSKPNEISEPQFGDPIVDEIVEKIESQKSKQKKEEERTTRNSMDYSKLNRKCCALDCGIIESVLNGKECKFCNEFCCLEHLLCHKHDCVKDKHVKFVRKSWLRKYGLNVSTGHYTVVCDDCGYTSQTASLIEIAGEERLSHISEAGCDSTKVFLEGVG